MSELTDKEKLNAFAARLGQLTFEFDTFATLAKSISFFASHELGTAESYLRAAERIIIKQAGKL